MKRLFFTIITSILLNLQVSAQIINKSILSPRQTGYTIDAQLNIKSKKISGSMEAFWVNKSNDVVPDIRLHLYMNAFKNERSTMNIELPGHSTHKESEYGWIDIKSFTDRNGTDLSSQMKFISPDDGNLSDQTVVQVILPTASKPGDTVAIKIDFETKLPSSIRRTGYNDDFYFVAQWFPKFGVYEPEGTRYAATGGWNCHQFHANSEFYSDHSLYKVKITVPKEYILGSGGMQIGDAVSDSSGKLKTITYRAEDIVDFAWTAWPGYSVFTDKWQNVSLTLLLPGERKEQVEWQFTAVKNALEYFNKNVGPYPWPYLTIVDPPAKGAGSAGMEYTTLFTSESSYMIPESIHLPEMVTVHEFGHAYFMGILASNEFEEPWLDEGVNTFFEERIMDHYYGENSGMIDFPFLKIPDKAIGRISYVHSDGRQAVSNKEYSWNYPHGTYGMMSYNKTATWLYTLMGIVGEETTNEIFREYYKKWSFRHPSGKDFTEIVNEVVTRLNGNYYGAGMDWFFDQTLYGTGICDYKVVRIYNNETGLSADTVHTGSSPGKSSGAASTAYSSGCELERAGEVMLPVDVVVHFSDGEDLMEKWDGKSRFNDFSYTGPRKIESVRIDPYYRIRMDVNFINNSMTVKPDHIAIRTLTDKLIALLQFFISFISL